MNFPTDAINSIKQLNEHEKNLYDWIIFTLIKANESEMLKISHYAEKLIYKMEGV